MDTEAQAALRGYNISWQTREGAPYSANDLARVSAGAAETIILMRPENARVSSIHPPCFRAFDFPSFYFQMILKIAAKYFRNA